MAGARINRQASPAVQGLARLAVLLSATFSVLLAVAYKTGLAGPWWLELLRYLPYPVFLVPALLALGLSLLLGWAWRLAAALGVGLLATVGMGLVLARGDSGAHPVRLMTYNIKSYNAKLQLGGFQPLAREVLQHNPDILVMQDAGSLNLARRAAAPDVEAAIFSGRNVYSEGQYLVVSRYPMRDCGVGDMSFAEYAANYVHCVVMVDGIAFDLVTVHFVSPRQGLMATRQEGAEGVDDWQHNFNARLRQAGKLARDFSGRQRPLVVAGDLNAPESSPVVQSLFGAGLRDAFSAAGWGYGYTHGHSLHMRSTLFLDASFVRIDHILVSPEIGVRHSFVGGKEASEHRPVIADLLLERDPD